MTGCQNFELRTRERPGNGQAGVQDRLLLPGCAPVSERAPCLKTMLNKGVWEKEYKWFRNPAAPLSEGSEGHRGEAETHPTGSSQGIKIQTRLISH